MADIIPFPPEVADWRVQAHGVADAEASKRGEILLFTGVRYSRHDDGQSVNNKRGPGKPKGRAKAS